jgi:hypothetical protein
MFQSTLKVGFAYVVLVAALGLTTVQAQNNIVVPGIWTTQLS